MFFSQLQPLLVILAGSVLHESPIFHIPIDLWACFDTFESMTWEKEYQKLSSAETLNIRMDGLKLTN